MTVESAPMSPWLLKVILSHAGADFDANLDGGRPASMPRSGCSSPSPAQRPGIRDSASTAFPGALASGIRGPWNGGPGGYPRAVSPGALPLRRR